MNPVGVTVAFEYPPQQFGARTLLERMVLHSGSTDTATGIPNVAAAKLARASVSVTVLGGLAASCDVMVAKYARGAARRGSDCVWWLRLVPLPAGGRGWSGHSEAPEPPTAARRDRPLPPTEFEDTYYRRNTAPTTSARQFRASTEPVTRQALGARGLVEDAGATWIGAAVIVDALAEPRLRRHLTVRSLVHHRELWADA